MTASGLRALLFAIALTSLRSTASAQASAQASAPAHRSSPTAFLPGERAEYRVHYAGLSVGRGVLSVTAPDSVRGTIVWPLRFEIDAGIIGFRLQSYTTSWFDPLRRLTLRVEQKGREGSRRYDRLIELFPERALLQERPDTYTLPSVAEPLDEAALLFALREMPLHAGETIEFDRYFRPDANPVRIVVLRRERVKVPAGEFEAIVVQPSFKTKGIFSEGGNAEVWISADPTHVVLKIRSSMKVGSFRMELTRYEPGHAVRSASGAPN